MQEKKISNTVILAELTKILKNGPVLQWAVKQEFIKKGLTLEDLEKGKQLMNLKLERRRNGYYLRRPKAEELKF